MEDIHAGKLQPIVTRRYCLLAVDLFISTYSHPENFEKVFDCKYYTRTCYITPVFYYGPEAAQFGDFLVKTKPDFLKYLGQLFPKIYFLGEELLKKSLVIRNIDYSNLKKEELLSIFSDFVKDYDLFAISLMGFNLQFPIEKKLKLYLSHRKNKEEELAILSFPEKENFSALEAKNLLTIRNNINSFEDLPKSILDEIDLHIKQFGWIGARGMMEGSWTKEDILARLKTIDNADVRLKELSELKKINHNKMQHLLKELNADEQLISWINYAKELVYFRTYRTDYLNFILFNVKPLLQNIANCYGLSYQEIIYHRIDEILSGNIVSKKETDFRRDCCALFTLEPQKTLFSSDIIEINKLKEKYCEEEIFTSELKGSAAYSGKVIGRVRVVVDKPDLIKVHENDILVMPMTTPDFVAGMQKAAAFITDEGGITCHAAIVAREMKKPCIIGTKNATKVLKDGDLVEVDANTGIVRKVTQ